MIGHKLSEYLVGEIDEMLKTAGSGLVEADFAVKSPAGNCRWVQVCIAEISRAHAMNGCRLVILRDISERKEVELRLAQSEEKFRSLAENLPGVVCIIADGRILYTNSHADSILGYEASEMLREEFDFSSIFNLADPGHFLVSLESELLEHGRADREVSVCKKDHTLLRALVSLQYIRYDDTKAVLCIITDVTSLYQTIDSLDETKKRYWALFEASSDAIFIETVDGRIFDCNSSCERIYGYTRAELLSKSASDLVPGDLLGMLKDLETDLKAKRGSERSVCLEALGIRKDGGIFPTEVTINPVKLEGLECFLVTVRDISARREAEIARQRYE
jgi:PAS domain S-box-containing protein